MQEKLVAGNVDKSNAEQLFIGDVSYPISFERLLSLLLDWV